MIYINKMVAVSRFKTVARLIGFADWITWEELAVIRVELFRDLDGPFSRNKNQGSDKWWRCLKNRQPFQESK
jgi:hypothetical protein